MKSTSNKCFSLTHANCAYLETIVRGHKSAVVNRALDNYRGEGFETQELLDNIAALQARLETEIPRKSPPGKSSPPMGGIRAILARMWPF